MSKQISPLSRRASFGRNDAVDLERYFCFTAGAHYIVKGGSMLRATEDRLQRIDKSLKCRRGYFFDVDGTLIKLQFTVEIERAIVREFPERAVLFQPAEDAWDRYKRERTHSFDEVHRAIVETIRPVFHGLMEADVRRLAGEIAPRVARQATRFTRVMVEYLKGLRLEERGLLVAITGSPQGLVDIFLKPLGFDLVYGCDYEIDANGRYNGEINVSNLTNKGDVVSRLSERLKLDLSSSIACGDSEHDVSMLEQVGHAFAVNPNEKLSAYARRNPGIVRVFDSQKAGVYLFRGGDKGFTEVTKQEALPDYLQHFPLLPGMC